MDYCGLKKKYIGLDILRIVSALVICMFHTTVHLGCDYGPLQGLSRMGAVFMTAFFLLSGFSLFVNWGGCNLTDVTEIKKFWKKRFLSIMPMYWFACIVFVVIQIILREDSILNVLTLAPVEVVGLQSVFSSLFGFSHNGGTWFISCIIICYFMYPFLQELIKTISKKARLRILIFCMLVLLYSPIVVYVFKLGNIYSNPFFRAMEFAIGMLLAAMKVDYAGKKFLNHYIYNWWTIAVVNIVMIVAISLAVKLGIAVGNYMLYNWICLPCFVIILLGLSGVDSVALKSCGFIKWLSGLTYAFFLAQLYSNTIVSKRIIAATTCENNILKIIIGWGSCISIAIILRVIEIQLSKIFKRKMK